MRDGARRKSRLVGAKAGRTRRSCSGIRNRSEKTCRLRFALSGLLASSLDLRNGASAVTEQQGARLNGASKVRQSQLPGCWWRRDEGTWWETDAHCSRECPARFCRCHLARSVFSCHFNGRMVLACVRLLVTCGWIVRHLHSLWCLN